MLWHKMGNGRKLFRAVIDGPEAYLDALEQFTGQLGAEGDPTFANENSELRYPVGVPEAPLGFHADMIQQLVHDHNRQAVVGYSDSVFDDFMRSRFPPVEHDISDSDGNNGGDERTSGPLATYAASSTGVLDGGPLAVPEVEEVVVVDGGPLAVPEVEMIPSDDECDFEEWGVDGLPGTMDDTIGQHFSDMAAFADIAPKRRRIRGKKVLAAIPRPPAQKLQHAARSRGVHPSAFKRMVLAGLPLVILNTFCFLESTTPLADQTRHACCEMFSGIGAVATAFRTSGYPAEEYDVLRHNKFENILTTEGFLTALNRVRCCRDLGLTHWATVCSTWVYLSRSSTGRSSSNPGGDTSVRCVRSANCMAMRVSYLLVLSVALFQIYVHEQPLTSLLSAFQPFVWARTVIRDALGGSWEEVFLWMASYGHELCKPTVLITNTTAFRKLYKPLSSEMRTTLDASVGVQHLPDNVDTLRRRVTGKTGGLKLSQEYPAEYGSEVFKLWEEHHAETIEEHDVVMEEDSDEEVPWDSWQAASVACSWPEARLAAIGEMLNVPHDRPLP